MENIHVDFIGIVGMPQRQTRQTHSSTQGSETKQCVFRHAQQCQTWRLRIMPYPVS